MKTNENEMGLKKIMDMTRLISVAILLLHFYDSCYSFFRLLGWTHTISDQALNNIHKTGLFNEFHKSKLLALVFLILSLLGVKAKKAEAFNYRLCTAYIVTGLLLYFISAFIFMMPANAATITMGYIGKTS
ncbi:MAG TPA: YWFCY domain-containing protein [Niabella sp.]|nr:YWFCY domain-containing protein [Niabella sp.]HQX21447.1 YWFCY domain-containing protein [Niabella sp.]HQX73482.1 YWFCY domain-containing protein [Chitinophagaceae bacterium]HRB36111.1 YWFCY domain-containing protein [Niabella sp.]